MIVTAFPTEKIINFKFSITFQVRLNINFFYIKYKRDNYKRYEKYERMQCHNNPLSQLCQL